MLTEESKRLRLFIERENLSQKDLVPVLGKDETIISRYLTGKKKIPLAVVKTLHIKLRLNYTWFFHGTGTMKVKELEKRNIMTDLTDIHAALGVIMASQDSTRELVNKLVSELYALKHNV